MKPFPLRHHRYSLLPSTKRATASVPIAAGATTASGTTTTLNTIQRIFIVPHQTKTTKTKWLRFFLLTVFLGWMIAQSALLVWWKWQTSFSSSSSPAANHIGYINGKIPLELVEDHHRDDHDETRQQQPPSLSRASTIHCVGETFLNNSWWYKSCHFTHLCYHTVNKEFHLFDDEEDESSSSSWKHATNFYSSTLLGPRHNHQLSPGGILAEEARRMSLPWFPRVLPRNVAPRLYWQVPSHPIIIPYFPRLANNAGHLIWDNWLPLYQLLRMFLFLKVPSSDELTSTATTSSVSSAVSSPHVLLHNLRNKGRCRYLDTWCQTHMIHKFLPMLGVLPEHYLDLTKANITTTAVVNNKGWSPIIRSLTTTTTTTHSSLSSDSLAATAATTTTSPYICFDHAVAGLGILTDHGTNQRHGQYLEDYLHPHNAVRGPIFYDFRTWVLRNLHIADRTIQRRYDQAHQQRQDHQEAYHHAPCISIRITVSVNSTKDPLRFWNAPAYVTAMQQQLPRMAKCTTIDVKTVSISQLSATEQIELAVSSTMFLSVVGGGSVTAMWLPPGASLILFYPVLTSDQRKDMVQVMLRQRKGHRQSDQYLTNVARLTLDWDVWNHVSYLRVHWLPLPSSRDIITTQQADGNVTSIRVANATEEKQSIQLLLHLIQHEAAFL